MDEMVSKPLVLVHFIKVNKNLAVCIYFLSSRASVDVPVVN